MAPAVQELCIDKQTLAKCHTLYKETAIKKEFGLTAEQAVAMQTSIVPVLTDAYLIGLVLTEHEFENLVDLISRFPQGPSLAVNTAFEAVVDRSSIVTDHKIDKVTSKAAQIMAVFDPDMSYAHELASDREEENPAEKLTVFTSIAGRLIQLVEEEHQLGIGHNVFSLVEESDEVVSKSLKPTGQFLQQLIDLKLVRPENGFSVHQIVDVLRMLGEKTYLFSMLAPHVFSILTALPEDQLSEAVLENGRTANEVRTLVKEGLSNRLYLENCTESLGQAIDIYSLFSEINAALAKDFLDLSFSIAEDINKWSFYDYDEKARQLGTFLTFVEKRIGSLSIEVAKQQLPAKRILDFWSIKARTNEDYNHRPYREVIDQLFLPLIDVLINYAHVTSDTLQEAATNVAEMKDTGMSATATEFLAKNQPSILFHQEDNKPPLWYQLYDACDADGKDRVFPQLISAHQTEEVDLVNMAQAMETRYPEQSLAILTDDELVTPPKARENAKSVIEECVNTGNFRVIARYADSLRQLGLESEINQAAGILCNIVVESVEDSSAAIHEEDLEILLALDQSLHDSTMASLLTNSTVPFSKKEVIMLSSNRDMYTRLNMDQLRRILYSLNPQQELVLVEREFMKRLVNQKSKEAFKELIQAAQKSAIKDYTRVVIYLLTYMTVQVSLEIGDDQIRNFVRFWLENIVRRTNRQEVLNIRPSEQLALDYLKTKPATWAQELVEEFKHEPIFGG